MARRKDVEDKLIGRYKAPRKNVLLALHDEVLRESRSDGGIILPQAAILQRNERVGTIIAVGGDIEDVAPGDRVLLDKRLGLTVPHEDDERCRLVLISEDQVLGVATGDVEREDYDIVKDGINL